MPHSPLTDRNPTHYLKRFGRDVHTSQHFRELVQNSIEANATDIEIIPEPTLHKNGIHKICVRDNGDGMTAKDMFKYLGSMNSSSKSSNSDHHENYGIGAKATTAYHNPYGVIFMSWTKDNPCGHLVWLCLENEQFGMKSFPMTYEIENDEGEVIEEETSDIVSYINGKATNVIPLHHEDYGDFIWDGVNWNSHKPACGHGTVVVLMGNHLEDNTWKNSEGKLYSRRELSHYLNQRYAYVPDGVSIKVSSVVGWNESYEVVGLLKSFETDGFLKHKEVVDCPNGFKVEVIITEKHSDWKNKYNEKKWGRGSPLLDIFACTQIEKGFVALQYDSERTSELYDIERGVNVARSWGISADSVIPMVKLIVHPPKFDGVRGVYPNEGRDTLVWSDLENHDARRLDLTKVREHFIDHMPQYLRNMIDEAFQSYKSKQVDITSILDRYNSIFKPRKNLDSALVQSDKGSTSFDPTGVGSTGVGTNPRGNNDESRKGSEKDSNDTDSKLTGSSPNPNGRVKGKKRKVKKQKDIIVKWLENSDDVGFSNPRKEEKSFPFFAVEDSDRIVVNANPNHDDIKCVLVHFAQKNKKASHNFIQQTIQEVYETEFQTYISHLLNENKSIAPYITKEVLKAKFLGCHLLWGEVSRKVNLQFR